MKTNLLALAIVFTASGCVITTGGPPPAQPPPPPAHIGASGQVSASATESHSSSQSSSSQIITPAAPVAHTGAITPAAPVATPIDPNLSRVITPAAPVANPTSAPGTQSNSGQPVVQAPNVQVRGAISTPSPAAGQTEKPKLKDKKIELAPNRPMLKDRGQPIVR